MTSKEGLTEEKHDQIIEGQKASLPFIIFGTYVSGPIGDKVKDFFNTTSGVGANILSKAFTNTSGYMSEVSADAVFERVNISKNRTYFFFGARFSDAGAVTAC